MLVENDASYNFHTLLVMHVLYVSFVSMVAQIVHDLPRVVFR